MKTIALGLLACLEKLRDLPPLFFRLILAYGFFMPATQKLQNFSAVVQWFMQIGIPYPTLSAFLSLGTEIVGMICLFLGLFTRLITIPLIFLLGVAITTVHWTHGFACGSDGFEVPLYYVLMLFSLLVVGPGRISLDAAIRSKWLEKGR